MFQLTKNETFGLVTICDRLEALKHSSSCPYVFTEQGIAMLSSVLNSENAISINISIMRAFVRIRRFLVTHKELAVKFKELEIRVDKNDGDIREIFEVIKKMLSIPEKPKRKIGFHV